MMGRFYVPVNYGAQQRDLSSYIHPPSPRLVVCVCMLDDALFLYSTWSSLVIPEIELIMAQQTNYKLRVTFIFAMVGIVKCIAYGKVARAIRVLL